MPRLLFLCLVLLSIGESTFAVGNTTRQFDLVSARVNYQVIFTGSFALTSLMFFPPGKGDSVLQMRLLSACGYDNEVPLRLESTQRFDVVLRDANRSNIWEYSDGKMISPGLCYVEA